jgi:2-polyprenyl-3-methyl-5-hydroxy-6-metoxy-1,4-benzoquinol methylase
VRKLVCAICRDNNNIHVLYNESIHKNVLTAKTFSARRTPDRIHYRLNICRKCSLIFSSPIFPIKKITKLYKESDFTYKIEAMYLADTYGHHLEKILPIKGRGTLKLLDIGCGNGFFLEKAKDLGVGGVYGLEPGKLSVAKARADIKKDITVNVLRKGVFKENTFDIICCFHTLDHIVDPNAFLKIIYSLLKKNGKILIITHNTNGLSVKLFGEKSPIFDIEHIYLFNEKTLPKICTQNGFKRAKIHVLKNKYPLFYWIRLFPMPKAIKKYLLLVLNATHIGNIPITLSAGNIVVTAQK